MLIVHVLILSLVEGLTEFLPVSSTGHLILTSHLLGIASSEFTKTFEIAIQLGAIMAVILFYWKKLLEDKTLIYKALVGFLPTGILGFLLYPRIKSLLDAPLVTLSALFLGGLALILLELYFHYRKKTTISKGYLSYKNAALIGLIQSISMIPGVSRSAASICGGLLCGLDRQKAVEFSFILAIPTMMAATGYDLLKSSASFTQNEYLSLALGIAASCAVALFAIKFLLKYVQKHTFIPFGIYRIILSILYFLLFIK